MRKIKLLRVTTVPISLHILLRGQLRFMTEQGYEVHTVSADGKEIPEILKEGVTHTIVPFTRKITPLKDLLCLWKLIVIIRRLQPDIIHTHTPKAGLLGMIAAWLCRCRVRMHTVAGLPVMEAMGLKRKILSVTEKITYACAHYVYPNSEGLRSFMLQEFKVKSSKLKIIGKGSSNGIDISYFSPSSTVEDKAGAIRKQYGVNKGDIVFSFVGRIVKDKGISELISAYRKILENSNKCAYLLLIGHFEQDLDPLNEEDYTFLHTHPQVILAGFQVDVRPWLMASDIFVFPSYREGFPNVVMQSCCLGVPCIVSDINGCNEIIQHEQTGLVVRVKDAEELYRAMAQLSEDEKKRNLFSVAARIFVTASYNQQFVWTELLNEYTRFNGRIFNVAVNVPTSKAFHN